jgi:hypothetical protein
MEGCFELVGDELGLRWHGYVGRDVCSGPGICVKLRSEFDAKRERMEPSWPLPMLLFILEFRPQLHEQVISNEAITSFLVFLQITCLCPRYEKHRGPFSP